MLVSETIGHFTAQFEAHGKNKLLLGSDLLP